MGRFTSPHGRPEPRAPLGARAPYPRRAPHRRPEARSAPDPRAQRSPRGVPSWNPNLRRCGADGDLPDERPRLEMTTSADEPYRDELAIAHEKPGHWIHDEVGHHRSMEIVRRRDDSVTPLRRSARAGAPRPAPALRAPLAARASRQRPEPALAAEPAEVRRGRDHRRPCAAGSRGGQRPARATRCIRTCRRRSDG
jgi:hypothetical protein